MSASREIATIDTIGAIIEAAPDYLTRSAVEIAKATVCRELDDQEFLTFMMIAARSGLDVFSKQIYAIKRNERQPDGTYTKRLTIQTGIDGYNKIAADTGELAGVDPIEYDRMDGNNPSWARATVFRRHKDGYIAKFTYTAIWREYVQLDRNDKPMGLWRKMPWSQLGKCALARAFRLGFPAQLSGIYTREEMDQADSFTPSAPVVDAVASSTNITALRSITPPSSSVSLTATTVDGLVAIATPATPTGKTLNDLYQDALALGLTPAQWTDLKTNRCHGNAAMIEDMLAVIAKNATRPARELDHDVTPDSNEGAGYPAEDSAEPVVTPAIAADRTRLAENYAAVAVTDAMRDHIASQDNDAQTALDAFNAAYDDAGAANSADTSLIRAGAVSSLQQRMSAIGWSVDVQERFTQRHINKTLDDGAALTPDDFHTLDQALADYEQKHAAKTDRDLSKLNTGRGNKGRN